MLANWIEFLTASVFIKHEGAGRVLVKFENTASSPDSVCVHKSSYTHVLSLGVVCANYIRIIFLMTLREKTDVLYQFQRGTGH